MTKHHKHPEEEPTEAAQGAAGSEDTLARLTEERDQLRDQLLRTMADFQNFRKRSQAEAQALRTFANENLVAGLLPVLDNFDRTIATLEGGASAESVMDGVQMIHRQLRQVLEQHQVSRISAEGSPFDPELHEAIATAESEEHPDGTVLAEMEAGYKMAERVLRPAKVQVSRKP